VGTGRQRLIWGLVQCRIAARAVMLLPLGLMFILVLVVAASPVLEAEVALGVSAGSVAALGAIRIRLWRFVRRLERNHQIRLLRPVDHSTAFTETFFALPAVRRDSR
jgi:hypothetical protein